MRATNFTMSIPQSPNVFSPEGAIDLHVSPEMRIALREMIDKKPKRLVVDLSRVPYVDSSGLAVLIGAMQSLELDGGIFMLAGAQKAVRLILESARLDQYFLLFPDVDTALAAP
jgi:anti-sigma B factor antagonist